MFEKLESSNSLESALLGICYFKGLGIRQNYARALELFTSSNRVDLSKFMLAVMEYYGIELKKDTASAMKKLKGTPVMTQSFRLRARKLKPSMGVSSSKGWFPS